MGNPKASSTKSDLYKLKCQCKIVELLLSRPMQCISHGQFTRKQSRWYNPCRTAVSVRTGNVVFLSVQDHLMTHTESNFAVIVECTQQNTTTH